MTIETLKSPNPRNRNSISVIKSKILSVYSMNTLLAILKVTDARLEVILAGGPYNKNSPPPPRCALRTFGSDRKAAKFRTQGDKFRVIRTRFRFDEEKFRFGEKKYHFDETNFRLHETKFRLLRCNNCKVSPLKQRCDLSQKKAMIVNQIVELMGLL